MNKIPWSTQPKSGDTREERLRALVQEATEDLLKIAAWGFDDGHGNRLRWKVKAIRRMAEYAMAKTEIRDEDGSFLGFEPRGCGEHRTVGPHRAWCFDCTEWCYPRIPCVRCERGPE